MYLLRIKYCDNEKVYTHIYSEEQIISFVNSLDYIDYEIEKYSIDYINGFNTLIPIHYTGWQPNGLMEFADIDGNILFSGYGEDH